MHTFSATFGRDGASPVIPEHLKRALGGQLADMVFTDPPYNVAYQGKTSKKLTIENDQLGAQFGVFLEQACHAMLGVTKGAIYICMSSSEIDVLKADELISPYNTAVRQLYAHFRTNCRRPQPGPIGRVGSPGARSPCIE